MFKCVFDGIRLNFDHLHRVADIPLFLSLMIDIARVVQGERRAELARAMLSRSPHSQSKPTLAEHFPNALQRYDIFSALPNFAPRFGAIFSTNSTN